MLHGPRKTQAKAKKLRREMSLPEVKLWQELRKRPNGMKFRRQHPAGPYVLDFYCPMKELAVEVDGKSHDMGDRPPRDERRDAWLTELGIRVLRIPASEVLRDVSVVVERIVRFAQTPPPPSAVPLP